MLCKICGDVSILAPKTTTLCTISRFYKTHYEVLKLSRSCTGKDIKNAFIKLSKEHHPDVNKCKQSHERFQEINEAYKVLGKPETRRGYDLGLAVTERHLYGYRPHKVYYRHQGRNPYDDPSFWANRDRTREEFYRGQPYYGVNGVPKLPNVAILMCCVLFCLVGIGLQCLLITRSLTFKREALKRRSLEVENQLKQTREAAITNGNVAQLEALRGKLLGKVIKEPDK